MIELLVVIGFFVAVFFIFDPLELCDDPIDPWLKTGCFVIVLGLLAILTPIGIVVWWLSKVL